MTTRLIPLCLGMVAVLAAPIALRAQAAPPAPATPPAPSTAPLPAALPQASSPPPPSAQVAVPVPPPNAVALCGDGSFVQAPSTAAACATRGGLRLTLPTRPSGPPSRPAVALEAPASVTAPGAASNQPPAGATMRCKDGTWLSGASATERCADRGGVATILPPERVPPR